MKRLLPLLLALCIAPAALAQGSVQQSGPVTPFHAPAWLSNGYLMDGGSPSAPFVNALGLFGGSACPLGVSSQPSAGLSTSQYSLFTVCQTGAATTFKFYGINGQATPNVYFDIGGTVYPFPGNIVPNTATLQASQNITAPALVNISSSFTIAYADATSGLPANGFVTSSVTMGSFGQVFLSGQLSGLLGLSGGPVFLSSTIGGGVSNTPPSPGSGQYVQQVGVAVASGAINFNPGIMNGPL